MVFPALRRSDFVDVVAFILTAVADRENCGGMQCSGRLVLTLLASMSRATCCSRVGETSLTHSSLYGLALLLQTCCLLVVLLFSLTADWFFMLLALSSRLQDHLSCSLPLAGMYSAIRRPAGQSMAKRCYHTTLEEEKKAWQPARAALDNSFICRRVLFHPISNGYSCRRPSARLKLDGNQTPKDDEASITNSLLGIFHVPPPRPTIRTTTI